MFTILNNQCRRILRKRGREPVLEQPEEKGIGRSDAFSDDPDHAQQFDIRAAFNTLEEEERMILAFSIFAGYQSDEIGRMLECSPATVRSRKSRALGKLRRLLENAV